MSDRKRKVDELATIKNPDRVKVLILTDQRISTKDFFFIRNFVEVKKMDLSYNKLMSFPIGFSFRTFGSLSTLFLHYNKFGNIKSILPLIECVCLQYLTLFGNNIQQAKTRHFLLNQIHTLKLMDDKIIKAQERTNALIDQGTPQIKFNFPLLVEDIIVTNDSSYFLSITIKQLYLIRRAYLQSNPVIRIQRFWRSKKKVVNQVMISVTEKYKLMKLAQDNKNRLITQKLEINKGNQQLIMSIFTMNTELWRTVRQLLKGKLYGIKQYCLRNQIDFTQQSQKICCLRLPQQKSSKRFLSFFQNTSGMFLLRKIGSQLPKLKINASKRHTKHLTQQQQNIYYKNIDKIRKMELLYLSQMVIIDLPIERKVTIVKKMYWKCQSNKSIFPFCFEMITNRTCAAISIQRAWKGYKVRKNNLASQMILKNRSAIKIQKWVRSLKFKHNQQFLILFNSYIKKQQSKDIIISSKDINLLNSIKQKHLNSSLFIINFQNSNFKVTQSSIIFFASRLPYPKYLTNILSIRLKNQQQQQFNSNIYNILFKQCNHVDKFTKNQQNYFKFRYNSKQQARNRKYLLALYSYQMKTHNFIKSQQLLSTSQLTSITQRVNEVLFIGNQSIRLNAHLINKIKLRYYNANIDHSITIGIWSLVPIFNEKKIAQKQKDKKYSIQSTIHRSQIMINNIDGKRSYRYQSQNHKDSQTIHLKKQRLVDISSDSIGIGSLVGYQQKKQKVRALKQLHKIKIVANTINKQQYLKKIREYKNQHEQKNAEIMNQRIQEIQAQKIKKYNRIKDRYRHIGQFQANFVNKGNQSIRIQLLRFQKKNNNKKSPKKHSVNQIDQSVISNQHQYTDIKDYSINQSKQHLHYHIFKTHNQQYREQDKLQQQQVIIPKSTNKIKKLIHSVFPEEYYPISNSSRLRLKLPKIKKQE